MQNRYHAARMRRVSAALIAPPSGEVATQFQSDSSPTDSPVRIRYAQPGSPVSGRHVVVAKIRPLTRCPSDLALQYRLGLLPIRRPRPRRGHPADSTSHGQALVDAGGANEVCRSFPPTAALGRSPVLGCSLVRSIVRRRALTLPACARPDQLLPKAAKARSRSN